jgi:Rab GDP dissociation inhibitor
VCVSVCARALVSLRRLRVPLFCSHNVVAKNKWIAFVSTTVETDNPEAELLPGSLI